MSTFVELLPGECHKTSLMVSTTMTSRWARWCLKSPFYRLFRRRSKKALKLRVTDLCEGNPSVTDGFPSQRDSNAEKVSIWWRHHVDTSSVNGLVPSDNKPLLHIPWICYERSFSEFYLFIWNQLVFNQRLQLFVQSLQPYLLIFARRN